MITITIPGTESWNYDTEKFEYGEATVLEFEHSLVSVSKWEAIHHRPFLTPEEKTPDEMAVYVRTMLLTPNISDEILNRMTEADVQALGDYVHNPMTGTSFNNLANPKAARTTERLSSELIYFWMNHFGINYETRLWHLNQLFTLIKVHHTKSQKPQKMSQRATAAKMAELNAQRRAASGSSG